MIVHTLPLGPFETNTYLLGCETTQQAVIIDPGFEAEAILQAVSRAGLTVTKILLTHGHVDHVSAVSAVKAATDAPVYIHSADRALYLAAPELGRFFGLQADPPPEPDHELAEGDAVSFGEKVLTVLHTPGHTPGGVCFLSTDDALLVSGDTLFYRGIGRTDLPGGSMRTLMQSIRQKIFTLDGATRVLPGHGPETTVREEMFSNPFVTL